MSAAADGSGPTTKSTTSDAMNSSTFKDQQKPAAALEEDDEFEDFPVDGKRASFYGLRLHACLGWRGEICACASFHTRILKDFVNTLSLCRLGPRRQ